MTDPRKAIQDAIYDALTAAGVTALVDPAETDAFPYTVFGGGTFNTGPATTKTTEGADVTHTLISWAGDPDTAMSNASTGLAALTDRDAPLTITGYTLVDVFPDFGGELMRDGDMGAAQPDADRAGMVRANGCAGVRTDIACRW
jgi:hypothetical protein